MTEPLALRARRFAGVVWATVRLDVARWRRDRVAIAVAVVLPLALAALISAALGSIGTTPVTLVLVDRSDDVAGRSLRDDVLGGPEVRGLVEVTELDDESRARSMLARAETDAVLVVPDGLAAHLAAGTGSGITVLTRPTAPIAGDFVRMLMDQFEQRAAAEVLAPAPGAQRGRLPLTMAIERLGGARLDPATHYGPSIGLFFVLVTMGMGAARAVSDRDRGVTERLAATRHANGAVALGRAVVAMAVGTVSMATMAVGMGVMFHHAWGPPLPVLACIVAGVFAMASVGAVLSVVARAAQDAHLLSLSLAFVFAVLSGTFSPPGSTGRPLGAGVAPTTHVVDAMALVSTGRTSLRDLAPSLGWVALLGGACLALAGALGRRRGLASDGSGRRRA